VAAGALSSGALRPSTRYITLNLLTPEADRIPEPGSNLNPNSLAVPRRGSASTRSALAALPSRQGCSPSAPHARKLGSARLTFGGAVSASAAVFHTPSLRRPAQGVGAVLAIASLVAPGAFEAADELAVATANLVRAAMRSRRGAGTSLPKEVAGP